MATAMYGRGERGVDGLRMHADGLRARMLETHTAYVSEAGSVIVGGVDNYPSADAMLVCYGA
jgi:hypothetical protein